MNDPAQKCDAQVVADIVEKHIAPQFVTVEDAHKNLAPIMILPKGLAAHSVKNLVDEYLDAPRRRKGTAHFDDLDSFVNHAKRFADSDSVLFADDDGPSLTSVLDYHRVTADGPPRFGEHRGVYDFPISDEWEAWTGHEGIDHQFTQAGFAEFIESRILDVSDPADAEESVQGMTKAIGATFAGPSRLLELSRGLSIRVDSKVAQAVTLATGEAQFSYVEAHTDEKGAPIKVPSAFLLAIPVFKGGALYRVAVRLRYRVRQGSPVTWFYELYRSDRVFDHAFKSACAAAAQSTGLPLFYGKPE